MTTTTQPGFFIGWKLESGLRYRNVLKILDYDSVIQGKTIASRSIQDVPEQEVYFPEEVIFPFAERRKLAIRQMQPISDIEFPPAPPVPDALPFDEDGGPVQGGDSSIYDLPKRPRREFNITLDRIVKYEPTPGCKACERMNPPGLKHTDECVARFRQAMQADGTLPFKTIQNVTPVSDDGALPPVSDTTPDQKTDPPKEGVNEFLEEEEDPETINLFGDFETPVDDPPSSSDPISSHELLTPDERAQNEEDRRFANVCKKFGPVDHFLQYAFQAHRL